MSILKKYIALAGLLSFLFNTYLGAQAPGWQVNPAAYVNSMNIIAQVQVDGTPENGTENLVAAFVGNEVRGVASPQLVGGQAYYFLTVYSNVVSGETVTFQTYLSDPDDVYPVLEEVVFVKNQQLGSIPDGFVLSVSLNADFPVSLAPIPSDTTLRGIPFPVIALEDYLISLDNDPVNWSVGTSPNLTGLIDGDNNLEVTPNNPAWTGTDSLQVTVTETGTSNGYSASQWVRFTVDEDYGVPVFDTLPVWFIQDQIPLPEGDLSESVTFGGPCLEYSVQLMLPEDEVPAPIWPQPNTNSGSMSLVVRADFGGNTFDGTSDLLAGYIDGQLAGSAGPSFVGGETLFFLTLANVGNGTVTFKFYDAGREYLHVRSPGLTFVPAGSAGVVGDPYVVDFSPILVEVDENGEWTTTVLDPFWQGEQYGMFYAVDCEYSQKIDSAEIIFLIGQCATQVYQLPNGEGLCLQADAGVSDIMWYQDGQVAGETAFHGALTPGVYHYEGLSPLGCPDIKSCPIIVEMGTSSGPPPGSPPPSTPSSNCGEISLASITVDQTPPVAICQSDTIYLDVNGAATITPLDVDGGSFTSCGVGTLSVSMEDFSCQHFGSNTIELTILDAAGRTASCEATVTVQDTIKPTVTCQNSSVSLDTLGQVSIMPASVFATGNDNCGTVNLQSVSPSAFDCTHLGANTVTLTVNDGHGNTNTCSATVTVSDLIPPTIVCKDIDLFLNAVGVANIVPNDVFESFSDNCGQIALLSVGPSAFSCSTNSPQSVTLLADDTHGNQASCVATVTLIDTLPPVIFCKSATVSIGTSGMAIVTTASVFESGTDNCGTFTPLSVAPNQFTCQDIGQNEVTLSVQDGNGNIATCSAVVTVTDETPPVASCKDVTVNLDENGQAEITALMVDDGSYDPCGLQSTSINQTTFDCSDLGPNTVTLTVTDIYGNVSDCQATVTVTDGTLPQAFCKDATISLDSTGSVTLPASLINDGSTDNCSVASMSIVPSTLHCINVGTTTVTLEVRDASNNVGTCTAIVTVPPFIVLDKVTVTPELCDYGNGSITIEVSVPTAPNAQIGYSINGGTSYQFSPVFDNLTPGVYNAKVVVFGTPGCGLNVGQLTVGEESIGTWYKDSDGDGHSDGSTQTACEQPATGWYLAVQLIATSGDCNDNDDSIYPGATELCNGIDDNCDGIVETTENTWTGAGDAANWADPANWSNGLVPLDCQDVIIPPGHTVTVETGVTAVGRTLEVATTSQLEVELAATLQIEN